MLGLQISKSMCVDRSTERFELRPPVRVGIKLAGVHWGYRTPSHAAEMTAGYYNTIHRDGYAPFFKMISDYNGGISFTCVEMRDCEHPPNSGCSPELLLHQIIHTAKAHGAGSPAGVLAPRSQCCLVCASNESFVVVIQ